MMKVSLLGLLSPFGFVPNGLLLIAIPSAGWQVSAGMLTMRPS
jgi:hypothetical protein